MPQRNRLSADASEFAHLNNLARRAKADDEKDDPDDRQDPDDQEDDPKSKSKGKSKRADADPDDQETDGDEDSIGDDEKGRKAKRRAKAEDDETDDEEGDDDSDKREMRGHGVAAAARRRERARCAAIFGSKFAASRIGLACKLAFRTSLSRDEALEVLSSAAPEGRASTDSRRNPDLGGGGESVPTSGRGIQDGWAAAIAKTPGIAKR